MEKTSQADIRQQMVKLFARNFHKGPYTRDLYIGIHIPMYTICIQYIGTSPIQIEELYLENITGMKNLKFSNSRCSKFHRKLAHRALYCKPHELNATVTLLSV